MYLQRLIERNPRLMEIAIKLHQDGRIPPNTWLIDLDAIAENARALSAEASRLAVCRRERSRGLASRSSGVRPSQ